MARFLFLQFCTDCEERYGLTTWSEYKGLSEQQVRDEIDQTIARKGVALPQNMVDAIMNSTIATHDLVEKVIAFPTDYNQPIKRYTCQADVTYRSAAVRTLAHSTMELLDTQTYPMILFWRSPRSGEYGRSMLAKLENAMTNCIKRRFVFTVQPAAGQFVITTAQGANIFDQQCMERSVRQ